MLMLFQAGTGWHQNPFTVTEHKGVLCARGVADDKGTIAL